MTEQSLDVSTRTPAELSKMPKEPHLSLSPLGGQTTEAVELVSEANEDSMYNPTSPIKGSNNPVG
ncbi:hypothetical protein CMI37_28080 [Candidatus Pacearchaeota archaeon]|nr:hypothetical protein [Candidatus Pacearchaeota archaeon]